MIKKKLGASSYQFIAHAVGQGLFTEVNLTLSGGETFRIVYDCGSTNKAHVDSAIKRSLKQAHSPIDLLIISHFDKDHISGVVELLRSFVVRRIMLPFVSKELRIASAILKQNCYLTSEQAAIIDNPVIKLSQLALKLDGLEPEFIFVRSSAYDNEDGYGIDFNERSEALEDSVIILDSGTSLFSHTKRLSCGRSLATEFELIPYNDAAAMGPNLNSFIKSISPYIKNLINIHSNSMQREAALQNLKADYAVQFGQSSYRKNLLSLFTYINPISVSETSTNKIEAEQLSSLTPVHFRLDSHKKAILLTGDGYLNSKSRVDALRHAINRGNLNLAVLQVSHHGAKGTWYSGLSAELAPIFAVFSSNPYGNYRHPHQSVVKDFSNRTMLFADTVRTCFIKWTA